MAHGFSLELLNELTGAGLATASTESVTRGSKPVEILLVKVRRLRRSVRRSAQRVAIWST
jgi:hypothetical protein